MKKSKLVMHFTAMALLIAAYVLEILPYGAVLIFTPGPGEKLLRTYSYFSMTPFGYANFAPLLTGILTVVAIALCVLCLIRKFEASNVQTAALICSIAAVLLSLVPIVLSGAEYMTRVSYSVSALLFVSAILQAVINPKITINKRNITTAEDISGTDNSVE